MTQSTGAAQAGADAPILACPQCHTRVRVPAERLDQQPRCPRCKAGVLPGQPFELDAAGLPAHIEKSGFPVLVDFWAEWCGPCQMMAPVLEQLALRRRAALQLAKVNTDAEQALAARYGIRSIPTLILFKDGRERARQAGALPAAALERWLDSALSG